MVLPLRFLCYCSFLCLLFGCSKPEENNINIPSEFSVSIVEQIPSLSTRQSFLEIASLTNSYCQEDTLIYNERKDSLHYQIDILNTYKANNCQDRKYFLRSLIALPDIVDSLDINVSLGSASLIKLRVYNDEKIFRIIILEGTGLKNKYSQTYKIPTNLIWGYAYPKSKEPTSETLMNSFRKDVEFDCQTHRLIPGFYSYFTITDSNILIYKDDPSIVGNYIIFYYFHSKSSHELDVFFNDLAEKYINLVGYQIYSGDGKQYKAY